MFNSSAWPASPVGSPSLIPENGRLSGVRKRYPLNRTPGYWPTFQYFLGEARKAQNRLFVRSPVISGGSTTLNCPRWRLCGKVDREILARLPIPILPQESESGFREGGLRRNTLNDVAKVGLEKRNVFEQR